MKKKSWSNLIFQLGALLISLLITSLLFVIGGAPPLKAFLSILRGSFGSMQNIVTVLIAWSPLLLTTAGVLITFSAGLWNIGMEGQITMGAIFTAGLLRILQNSSLPPFLIITLGILSGILGGALWAALVGVLKNFGGVNEIFGGLGLNFVAAALTLYLVFGPWKRPGVASMSGTEPFDKSLWLPGLFHTELSPVSLILSILAILFIFILLRGTHFGLRLKAVGKNPRAAFLMGIPAWQYSMYAFLLCGALAGLTGALQVTGQYHRLLPNISSGYGFLGLMVAMLINYQALWAAPVALFFAAINTGGLQLQIWYKLSFSVSGVMQDLLVLLVLLGEGVRQRVIRKE
jgi:general nucleoside transport system permease protein